MQYNLEISLIYWFFFFYCFQRINSHIFKAKHKIVEILGNKIILLDVSDVQCIKKGIYTVLVVS